MSIDDGKPAGAEQRRFARVPIKLDALISIGQQAPVPCTVRDFCVGGMFLTADPAVYATVKPQTPAVLYFALIVGGEKSDYHINLLVARAVPKGIGVSFADPEPDTLALLGQLAAPEGMPTLPESAADVGRSQAGFASEFSALESPLKALVAEHVKAICDRFLEEVDERLFFAARDAGNNADEGRYLDGQREMRGRQKRVRDEVPAKIDLGISILGNPLSDHEKDPATLGMADLSLIEKDEFEEFLAVSEMVLELEPEFHAALFELNHRLSYLANREIEVSALPIGPDVLCNAISDCLKGLQSERRVILKVYRVLHEVMSKSLGEFYLAVNSLLIERGIVPVIDRNKPAVKRSAASNMGFNARVPDALSDTVGQVIPAEEHYADLMPGPDNYNGRPNTGVGASPMTGVQAATPSVPAGVQVAPPRFPGATVQAAPPNVPHGAVQAAPPSYAASGVQSAPPSAPGGFVQSAPPSVPAGLVQPAAPSTMPGAVQGAAPGIATAAVTPAAIGANTNDGFAGGFAETLGGWFAPPRQYVAPTVGHSYSAAQAQLALRRDLMPTDQAQLTATTRERGAYSTAQIVQGLAGLQRDYAAGNNAELLDADAIKQRIVNSLIGDGAPQKMVSDESIDAIEVVANLFSALLQDSMVAKSAKAQLTRLQPSVHRAALVDSDFFESSDHPVRQVINRVSQLRDGKSEAQQQRSAVVGQLVSRVNQNFDDDVGVFETVVSELDEVLQAQENEYQTKVAAVVASCEQQQQLLEQRRKQSMEETDGASGRSDLPEEWHKWLDRSRKLEVGQRVIMNATSPRAMIVTLAWKEARNNLFVFVDDQGSKASTLTQQQVAMHLRRGVIVALDDDMQPALERAMVGVVERFHSQVENHATRDSLTGFLLGKFFAEEIDAALPDAEAAAARNAVVCHIAIENLPEINEAAGAAAGDAAIKAMAEELRRQISGKNVVFGRLDGAVFGVYWRAGGIEAAYKKMQSAMAPMSSVKFITDGLALADADATIDFSASLNEAATTKRPLRLEIVAGISASADNLLQAEGLLSAARDACESAREMGPSSIYVSGSETEQRKQMEQLVAYADQALARDCLTLSAQHVTSLTDPDLPPAMYIAVGAFDRNGKVIPAHRFAPALARCSSAAAIDAWAFKQTLAWMVANEEKAEAYALVVIPLTSASIKSEDLPNMIISEFMETPVPPGRICFALPDRDVVENILEVGELISTLKEFGCRFVLDEFGSGHENYDYIKSIDVDFVTVKTSFVSDAQKNPKDFAMAKSINELVHFMGKKTIGKQGIGLDLRQTIDEIGIDFLHEQAERAQLVPEASAS